MPARKTNPVLIVGCARSGTSLLSSMLSSAGNFANYRAETRIFDVLGPRFGGLRTPRARARALAVWEKSDQCAVADLEMEPFRLRIFDECRNTGDFLRIFMESLAHRQGMTRWVDDTPGHLLYMRAIKQTIPNVLFVHVIRDGRDVALSLHKQGWVRPFPWDGARGVLVAGIYWRWMVSRGIETGRAIGPDYLEVHYEDLVARPQETLDAVGAFIGQPLSYEQILRAGVGEVTRPNTSFSSDANFVGRWQKYLAARELAGLEQLIGPALERLGYQRASAPSTRRHLLAALRPAYEAWFAGKHLVKAHTPLSRWMVNLDTLQPGAIYTAGRPSATPACSSYQRDVR